MNTLSRYQQSIKLNHKWIISLFCTVAFFALYLLVYRPGYQVDDDITMISLASGYLGGKPVPFLVFSNVLLGFILNFLYGLPTSLNWEVLLFIAVNFLSVWSLLYLVLSFPLKPVHWLLSVLAVLLCDSYILISITFTTIAAFAALAGFCLILGATRLGVQSKRRLFVFGGALILAGGLIRIESVLLVALTIALPSAAMFRYFDWRALSMALAALALAVAGCYAFDRLYVSSSPEWKAFYTYNDTRSLIQDTPRFQYEHIKDALEGVGWSHNDYEMFMSWFLADGPTFSLDNLRYLVGHVPAREPDLFGAVLAYFYPQPAFDPRDSAPYLLVILAAWLAALLAKYSQSDPPLRKAILPLALLLGSFLAWMTYLIWADKVPLRVWYSFLTTLSIFGLFILACAQPSGAKSGWRLSPVSMVFSILILAAGSLVTVRAVEMTQVNITQQADYRRVLADLQALQAQGEIKPNALIVSPAGGIPLVWSDPLTLDFPKIQYLEMGWLTFSPPYEEVLTQHNAQPLLTSLYQSDHVYLMAKRTSIDDIVIFIQNHSGAYLLPDPLYALADHGIVNGVYARMVLYRLRLRNLRLQ